MPKLFPCVSLDRARRYLRASSSAMRLFTVDKAASFIAVALATMSACDGAVGWLKVATMGVLVMEAQLAFPRLYGEKSGGSAVSSGPVIVVFCSAAGALVGIGLG